MLDKFKGCLVGLAIGDALGAPVKFLSQEGIKEEFGQTGILDFEPWGNLHPGSFTANTELALMTAEGCLRAYQVLLHKGKSNPAALIYERYLEWMKEVEKAKTLRHPDYQTLRALKSERMGTIEFPISESKGCGALARVIPAGLSFPPDMAFREGAEYAAITHGHPSGYLPAGFIAEVVAHILIGEGIISAVKSSLEKLKEYEAHNDTLSRVNEALKMSLDQHETQGKIESIGEGWEAAEVLAASIYFSIRFSTDFKGGTLAAVNNSSDSSTLGALTGALLGVYLGIDSIPKHWVQKIEKSRFILEIAEDMFLAFKKGESPSIEKYPLD